MFLFIDTYLDIIRCSVFRKETMKYKKTLITLLILLCFFILSCSNQTDTSVAKPGFYTINKLFYKNTYPAYGLTIYMKIDSIEIYDDYTFEVFCKWICVGTDTAIAERYYLTKSDDYDTNFFYVVDDNSVRYDHENRLEGGTRGFCLYPGGIIMGSYRFGKLVKPCSMLSVYDSELMASLIIWLR